MVRLGGAKMMQTTTSPKSRSQAFCPDRALPASRYGPGSRPRQGGQTGLLLALAVVLGPIVGCEKKAGGEATSDSAGEAAEPVQRIDLVPYNPRSTGTDTGPCKAFFSFKGTVCGQRGKAAVLDKAGRKAVLALLKDKNSFRHPTAARCWAPRHALILMDKESEQIGYFDVSLPCGKIRGGDRHGAMQTPEGEIYEDLTEAARNKLGEVFKRNGIAVDAHMAVKVPRGKPLPVRKITGYLPQTGSKENQDKPKMPAGGH